jgi:hypothetical protein
MVARRKPFRRDSLRRPSSGPLAFTAIGFVPAQSHLRSLSSELAPAPPLTGHRLLLTLAPSPSPAQGRSVLRARAMSSEPRTIEGWWRPSVASLKSAPEPRRSPSSRIYGSLPWEQTQGGPRRSPLGTGSGDRYRGVRGRRGRLKKGVSGTKKTANCVVQGIQRWEAGFRGFSGPPETSMVRRGSTVRVRQRASPEKKDPQIAGFLLPLIAPQSTSASACRPSRPPPAS